MAVVTTPDAEAIIAEPVEAPISIPLWLVDAPAVGWLRGPNPLVIRWLDGHGHTKPLADGVTAKLKPKDGMVVVSRTVKHEHQKTL